MLLQIYEIKEVSFWNNISLGREIVKCMAEFHEGGQLDQKSPILGPCPAGGRSKMSEPGVLGC